MNLIALRIAAAALSAAKARSLAGRFTAAAGHPRYAVGPMFRRPRKRGRRHSRRA